MTDKLLGLGPKDSRVAFINTASADVFTLLTQIFAMHKILEIKILNKIQFTKVAPWTNALTIANTLSMSCYVKTISWRKQYKGYYRGTPLV